MREIAAMDNELIVIGGDWNVALNNNNNRSFMAPHLMRA